MAKIAAQNRASTFGFERQDQIACAAAQVESLRSGGAQEVAEARYSPGTPIAVDVKREKMIGQVVAMRYTGEHCTNPVRRFALGGSAGGRGTSHASAAWIAARTSSSSTPDTTVTSPILRGNTKCTFPARVFLSAPRRPNRFAASIPPVAGIGPYRVIVSRMVAPS